MTMTIYNSAIATPTNAFVIRDTNAGLSTTTRNNVFPPGGACTLWEISVDNSQNAATSAATAQTVYIKIYDATTSTSTSSPTIQFPFAGGVSQTVQIVEGWPLASGCSFAVATAGGVSSGNNPTNPVTVTLALTA